MGAISLQISSADAFQSLKVFKQIQTEMFSETRIELLDSQSSVLRGNPLKKALQAN